MTATPPRADLRTLAAEAKENTCDHPVYVHKIRGGEPLIVPSCQLCGEIGWDDLREQVAEHRRMVLGAAADDLHRVATHLRATNPDSSVAKGVRYAEARIRAQLTAAPPAGLSAPVPAGNAPAVPEEADGQRAGEGDALTYAEMEADRDRLAAQVDELRRYAEEHRQRLLHVRDASGEPGEVSQVSINVDEADVDELRAEVRWLDRRLRWAYQHSDNDATASMLVAYELADQRDDLAAQVAHYQRVIEAAKAWRKVMPLIPGLDSREAAALDTLAAAVDALVVADTDQTEDETDVHL